MPKKCVRKSIELRDAKIQFMSLVDRPANRRPFLLTKCKDKSDLFALNLEGKILKSEDATHYVTGIATEPMTPDTDDNFMTEREIEKMAHWFMKHGRLVDEQHNFEANPNCQIVESWIATEDTELGGQPVKRGSWLVKVEVQDDAIWTKVQNGDLTGFSIGGLARYGTEEVDLTEENNVEKQEKRGLLASIAKALGLSSEASLIEKGALKDSWTQDMTANGFWTAWEHLSNVLHKGYVSSVSNGVYQDGSIFEHDPQAVYDALKDFCEIVTELLVEAPEAVTNAIEVETQREVTKAGRKMSAARLEQLTATAEQLTTLVSELSERKPDTPNTTDDNKEDTPMTDQEMDKLAEKIAACMNNPKTTTKAEQPTPDLQSMIDAAVAKAMSSVTSAPTTPDDAKLQQMIDTAVAKAVGEPEPQTLEEMIDQRVAKAVAGVRGTPGALNDSAQPVQKDDSDPYGWGNLFHK